MKRSNLYRVKFADGTHWRKTGYLHYCRDFTREWNASRKLQPEKSRAKIVRLLGKGGARRSVHPKRNSP